jgi:hypothetical protein
MNTLILVTALLGLGLGSLYTLLKPRWAILFIIVLYPLEQLLITSSGFFAANGKLLNILVGGLAVFGSVSALLAGRAPFRGYFNGVMWFTLALYVWAVMGIAFTPDQPKAIDDLTAGLPYLVLFLAFPAMLVQDLPDFRRLMVPVMVAGTAIVAMIVASPNTAMFGGRLGMEGVAGGGAIQNPLAPATLGGTIAIIGVLYKPERGQVLVHMIRGAAVASGLAIAMLSGSRGQLLAAAGCALLLFPFARQIKNLVQFIAVGASAMIVLVFGYLVLSLVTTSDAAGRWDSESLGEGLGNRFDMVLTLVGEWASSPANYLQGLGTSSFLVYWRNDKIPYIHNMVAQVLTEHGLVGMAILGMIMLLTLKASFDLLRMFRDRPQELSTAAILIAICLYQFLLSLKQGSFFTSGMPFSWFLILSKIHARSIKDAALYGAWPVDESGYDEEHGYGELREAS